MPHLARSQCGQHAAASRNRDAERWRAKAIAKAIGRPARGPPAGRQEQGTGECPRSQGAQKDDGVKGMPTAITRALMTAKGKPARAFRARWGCSLGQTFTRTCQSRQPACVEGARSQSRSRRMKRNAYAPACSSNPQAWQRLSCAAKRKGWPIGQPFHPYVTSGLINVRAFFFHHRGLEQV